MQYYLIKDTVVPCTPEELSERGDSKVVAVMKAEEWKTEREHFQMGIEFDPTSKDIRSTKAEANYGSLTGTFKILNRDNLLGRENRFAFALDDRGMVFIDEHGTAQKIVDTIAETKRWREPSMEHFIYDFLEQIVKDDLHIMEKMEKELDEFEDRILAQEDKLDLGRINEMRGQMRDIRIHYEQLIDMTQELEENENGFFKEKDLHYLHLFMNRMLRLSDIAASVRDHTTQVRELYQTQLDVRQNRTMTLLTVIATIFMPLTLITSWYGMNFRHMPELEYTWSYPVVIIVCLVIAVGCLIFFKKKKWL